MKRFAGALATASPRVVLLALLTLLGAAPPLPGKGISEADLKAAFLLNIVRFVQWPDSAFAEPGAPLVIWILDEDEFPPEVWGRLRSQRVHGRAIDLKVYQGLIDAPCHVLYCNSAPAAVIKAVLGATVEAAVLTIGDGTEFGRLGGMISFERQGSKLRLEFNAPVLDRSKVKVSSQLLQMGSMRKGEGP